MENQVEYKTETEQERKERIEACTQKVNELIDPVLAEFNCYLTARVTFSDRGNTIKVVVDSRT